MWPGPLGLKFGTGSDEKIAMRFDRGRAARRSLPFLLLALSIITFKSEAMTQEAQLQLRAQNTSLDTGPMYEMPGDRWKLMDCINDNQNSYKVWVVQ